MRNRYKQVSVCFVAICAVACASYAQDGIFTAEAAIDLCAREYSEETGRLIIEGVDRAYVHMRKDRSVLGVLFASGEVGTFGPRSESYAARLSCGVTVSSDSMSIFFLQEVGQDILRDDQQDMDSAIYAGSAEELLFLRDGNGFTYSARQPLRTRD